MHTHITRDDRVCISLMLRKGYTYTDIGKELGFHRTTISREIRRNGLETYEARKAHKLSMERRKKSKANHRILDNSVDKRNIVIKHLKKDWSPEQISGFFGITSAMTIYRYIDRNSDLRKYLRRGGKKRRRYGTKSNRSRYQAGKKSIHDRELTSDRGHWEADTIVGKERNMRIITYVDKMTGYLVASLSDATADGVYRHAKEKMSKLPCKTITYDNGSEFSLHKMIERVTGAEVFFADPGKPHQRGSNENINGLLRQYFPKGSSFASITNTDVERRVKQLNSRPRKRHGYLPPQDMWGAVEVGI